MTVTRRALAGAVATLATAAAVAAAVPASAGPSTVSRHWASAGKATVHPGVSIEIGGVTCVAGYVLADSRRVFLAVPASCSGVTEGDPVDGCTAAQDPFGTPATVQGARYPAKLVYSSFTQMQLHGEHRSDRCANNSLSLVQLDPRDIARTNPSLPVLGGPTKVSTDAPAAPDQLSVLLSGTAAQAAATSTSAGGWAHAMVVGGHVDHFAVGSPVLTTAGAALGMVTLVPFQGGPGQTTVSDLSRVLKAMQHIHGFRHVRLVAGTEPFKTGGVATPLG